MRQPGSIAENRGEKTPNALLKLSISFSPSVPLAAGKKLGSWRHRSLNTPTKSAPGKEIDRPLLPKPPKPLSSAFRFVSSKKKLAPYFCQHGIDFRDLADFYLDTKNADLGKAYECAVVSYPEIQSYRLAFFKCRRDSFAFLLLEKDDQEKADCLIAMKDWATIFRYQKSYVLDLDCLPTRSIVSFSSFLGGHLEEFIYEQDVIDSPSWLLLLQESYERLSIAWDDRASFLEALLDELSYHRSDMNRSRLGELGTILAKMASNFDFKKEIYEMSVERLGKTHGFLRTLRKF